MIGLIGPCRWCIIARDVSDLFDSLWHQHEIIKPPSLDGRNSASLFHVNMSSINVSSGARSLAHAIPETIIIEDAEDIASAGVHKSKLEHENRSGIPLGHALA